MSRSLTMKDINIVEEYFANGFNKSKAFEKYNKTERRFGGVKEE